jgi:hypothetical protein
MSVPGDSLWPRIAALPLVVEGCAYDRLHAVLARDFHRVTTHVRLVGGGTDGLGEDVSIHVEDGTSLHETRPGLPLEGERRRAQRLQRGRPGGASAGQPARATAGARRLPLGAVAASHGTAPSDRVGAATVARSAGQPRIFQ